MAIDLVAGDTGTMLRISLRNRGTTEPINLTGATVRLKYRIDAGVLITQVMTIADAATGVATYQFGSGELTAAAQGSSLRGEVEVTDAGGKVLTQLKPMTFTIRAKV